MNPSPELVGAMLAEDSTHIDQLRQLLECERKALESREHADLPELIEAKNRHLAALGEHALQRQNWLRAAGLSCDHTGWQQWLSQNPTLKAQTEAWNTLAEQFRACREFNEVNGKIINRAQHTLGQLLNLLRGQDNSAPDLYNAKGRTGSGGGSQTLVKA